MIAKRFRADYENACYACWSRVDAAVIEGTLRLAVECFYLPADFDARCLHNPPEYARDVVIPVPGYTYEKTQQGWVCIEYDSHPWNPGWGTQQPEPTLLAAEAKMRRLLEASEY